MRREERGAWSVERGAKREERRVWSVERGAWRATTVLLLTLFLFLFLFLLRPVTAQEGTVPTETPDAAVGLIVFNERCANCHGPQALGDGEMAAQLPNPPAALASPDYLRVAVPADMFAVITSGRPQQGMPPFGPVSSNPLAEVDRWNAIAAVYSLGTPLERVTEGQAVYNENCLACHGEGGTGDGLDASLPDLTDLTYWSQISNQAVFDRLHDNSIEGHDFELDDDSLWAVVDYLRTLGGYAYTDALAAFRPIESATINGQVVNGSSDEAVAEVTEASLRAFNRDLELTLTMTATVAADGRFQFNLSDVPAEWFYRVAVNYKGLDFGSEIAQLSAAAPAMEMPVTVYEQTSDPAAVTIEQMHLILEVADEEVLVNEVYVFSNNGPAVFVGETGEAAAGTVKIALPAEAQSASFERGLGSFDSFLPAQEVVAVGADYVDTLPLRPGQASLILLATYSLPYDSGLTVNHPVYYEVGGANLVLSDVGVELTEADDWASLGPQAIEGGSFLSYSRAGLAAGEVFSFELSGRPRSTGSSSGGSTAGLVRNQSQELIIGGVALLAVAVAAVFVVRSWQQGEEAPDRMELLQAIADLDDDYEQGQIGRVEYEKERQALKAELLSLWPAEQES